MKKQKGFTPVILIVVLALVGAMGAYFFWSQNKLQAEPIVTSPTFSSSPHSTAIPQVTNSWKEYTYKDLIIQYPADWTLVTNKMTAVRPPSLISGDEFPAITFYAINNPTDLTVKEYDEKISSEGMSPGLYSPPGNKETIAEGRVVNGVKGYYLKDQNCEPLGCDKFSFAYNKKIYVITNIYDHQTTQPYVADVYNSEKAEMRKTFDQIFVSLRFLK